MLDDGLERGGSSQAKTSNGKQAIAGIGAAPWNRSVTLERLGGDEKLLHEVMRIFAEEAPKHLSGLRDAIAQQDAGRVERIAHRLQGELGYLTIPEVLLAARELEEKGRNSDFEGALRLLPSFEADVSRLLHLMVAEERASGAPEATP
jgi:HPt (histidine-containing phosphotransfer) domain-containing protein